MAAVCWVINSGVASPRSPRARCRPHSRRAGGRWAAGDRDHRQGHSPSTSEQAGDARRRGPGGTGPEGCTFRPLTSPPPSLPLRAEGRPVPQPTLSHAAQVSGIRQGAPPTQLPRVPTRAAPLAPEVDAAYRASRRHVTSPSSGQRSAARLSSVGRERRPGFLVMRTRPARVSPRGGAVSSPAVTDGVSPGRRGRRFHHSLSSSRFCEASLCANIRRGDLSRDHFL
ncbi:uncharacterized protein LOC128312703 [Acinonyx jubatus]|uniref:Uncharacterized protein LOC128312703 n=1 Tax=Acinonyx jubatus TaxID=32536 RepID=A0ABM3NW91_ACIJB|nr:uncharacterized protein LOC128312703 [Acinonyx jubatus]